MRLESWIIFIIATVATIPMLWIYSRGRKDPPK